MEPEDRSSGRADRNTEAGLAERLAELNIAAATNRDLGEQWLTLNADSLAPDLVRAESENPLVRAVMTHLKSSDDHLALAPRPIDGVTKGGCNRQGMWDLRLTGDGFRICVNRTTDVGLVEGFLDWTANLLTDGPFPKGDSFTKLVKPTSSRLRCYDITFSEVMDIVTEAAKTAVA